MSFAQCESQIDPLQPLASQDVSRLLEVLHRDLPYSVVALNWIRKQSEWARIIPHVEVQILCPGGDWRDGSVVGLTKGLNLEGKYDATIYTLQESCERLQEALSKTQCIPWLLLDHFDAVVEKHFPLVNFAFTAHGLKAKQIYPPGNLYYIPEHEARQISIPVVAGARIGPLDPDRDLNMVCSLWPRYASRIRPKIYATLKHNITVGVFVTSPVNGEEELAAMVVETSYGGIGMLQTVPHHRRKGLASIALATLAVSMGQVGITPHLHVMQGNDKAMDLVKKVGFKRLCYSAWILEEREQKV